MSIARGVSLIVAAGAVVSVHADDGKTEVTLGSVKVTAQRIDQTLVEAPVSVTVITDQQVESSGARTVYALLDNQVGISNMSYGPDGREFGLTSGRLIIRGLDKGTLMLLNGAPMNLMNYNGSENVPMESIERVELIRGASSTLYGSEALAGAVNIVTRRAHGEPRSRIGLSGGNYQSRWTLGHENEKIALHFSRTQLDGIGQTSKVFPSSTTYWRLEDGRKDGAFATANLTDYLSFNWTYSYLESERTRLPVSSGTTMVYDYEDTRHGANLVYDHPEQAIKAVAYYNSRDLDARNGALGTVLAPARAETIDLYNAGVDVQKTWQLFDGRDTVVTGGGVATEDFHGVISGYDADRQITSLYASYAWRTFERLTTTFGLRGQLIDDYAKDYEVVVGQIQTNYLLTDNWSWFVNVGESFQMPPLNQYFSRNDGEFEQLKPQRGWSYETGFKHLDGNNLFTVAVYSMDITDKFVWVRTPDNREVLTNSGDFRNTGIEVEYKRALDNAWTANLGGSVSSPESNDSGKWVQDSSRIQLVAGIEYRRDGWLAALNYMHVGDRENAQYRTRERTPERDNLNLLVKYQIGDHAFTLNARNLLDRENPLNKYENWDMPFNWTLAWDYTFR
ncbi:MAG: TonB-dependent receptor [Porticoccaceae bacterium]